MSEETRTTLPSGQTSFLGGRTLVWFSCGAASAVAAKIAIDEIGSVEVVHCDTLPDEHEDNVRFFGEVQDWLGQEIVQLKSDKYATCDDVYRKTGYMAGIGGARCTTELKKAPRLAYQWAEDTHIFGFTSDEGKRQRDFEYNNPELLVRWILAEHDISKQDCYSIISAAGIELPTMYKLGYRNNNCKGCVKATSAGYWNKVRKDFPEVFELRATRSRSLGARLVRHNGERIFLDELPEGVGVYKGEDLSCGPTCNGQQVVED